MNYVKCSEQEELPLPNEGYTYHSTITPPLRQDEMVHFFHSPQCVQGSTACLRRIPKKMVNDPVYGWALYVQDSSLGVYMIVSASFVTVVVVCLYFYSQNAVV
jgi:hypothetical protein